jgi:hypothetical protein
MASVLRSALGLAVLTSSALVLSVAIPFTISPSAAKEHHSRPRHTVVRHRYYASPGLVAVPRVVDPPVIQDQTPSYNDPSKWGGGAP